MNVFRTVFLNKRKRCFCPKRAKPVQMIEAVLEAEKRYQDGKESGRSYDFFEIIKPDVGLNLCVMNVFRTVFLNKRKRCFCPKRAKPVSFFRMEKSQAVHMIFLRLLNPMLKKETGFARFGQKHRLYHLFCQLQ
jgi:hypothetical protein